MIEIAASEFKAKCLRLLDEVQLTGQELVVSKRGRAIVRVVPERNPKPWLVLRGRGRHKGDPFAPAVTLSEIDALK
jgi:prevent-host-death family protein